MAMKYSIVRGHQLWQVYNHPSPLSPSIPGSIVANAQRVLVNLIQNQNTSLRESIANVKKDIDEEYRMKIESGTFPIILPQGRFADGAHAPINVIYNYYGLKHFEVCKKFCLCYEKERDFDCAFTFFDKGVRPLLRTPQGDETIEYQMLKTLFIKEPRKLKQHS